MKKKLNAYEMNEDSSLNKVVKCDDCGFKAVKAQFLDCGSKCPRCGKPMKVKKYKEE